MPKKSSEKLTCDLPKSIKQMLEDYGFEQRPKKGARSLAYRQALEQAFLNPDGALYPVDPNEELATIHLDAKIETVLRLTNYQRAHKIREQRAGFRHAILRGCALLFERH